MSNTKDPKKIVLGTVVYYKKVCHLQAGKYIQLHQEDETWNKIDIDQTVVSIFIGTQYNIQVGYFK